MAPRAVAFRQIRPMKNAGASCAMVSSRSQYDASVSHEPLLGLSSGYIQRSAHLFPKQGSKSPWQVHQSYLRDYRAMKTSDIVDDAMVFSNPTGPSAVAAAS